MFKQNLQTHISSEFPSSRHSAHLHPLPLLGLLTRRFSFNTWYMEQPETTSGKANRDTNMSLRQLGQESLGMNRKVPTQTADDCFHHSSSTVLKTPTTTLHHLEAINYCPLISTLITFSAMCNITFLGSQYANSLKLLSRHLTLLKMKSDLFNRCSYCACGFCLLTPFYY